MASEEIVLQKLSVLGSHYKGEFSKEIPKRTIARAKRDFKKGIRPKYPDMGVVPIGYDENHSPNAHVNDKYLIHYRQCADDDELLCLLVMDYFQNIKVKKSTVGVPVVIPTEKTNVPPYDPKKYTRLRYVTLTVKSSVKKADMELKIKKFLRVSDNNPISHYGGLSEQDNLIVMLLDYAKCGKQGLRKTHFSKRIWTSGKILYDEVNAGEIDKYIKKIKRFDDSFGDIGYFERILVEASANKNMNDKYPKQPAVKFAQNKQLTNTQTRTEQPLNKQVKKEIRYPSLTPYKKNTYQ